jgi:dienelactone hydrolase
VREPLLVRFARGSAILRGNLYLPDSGSDFPAVLWNHGSERFPRPPHELARFFTSAGYAVLAPHRLGHGHSPGEYSIAGLSTRARRLAEDDTTYRRQAIGLLIELHEERLGDTLTALEWLARHPSVDPARIAVSGASHGGIQTLLAAEADAGARAYVAFAPAAIGWRGNPELQDRLLSTVLNADRPIFLLQAANDYSLGPSELLGEALRDKGPPNLARVYPPFGLGRASGHAGFACEGMGRWGVDVLAFLDEVMGPLAAAA